MPFMCLVICLNTGIGDDAASMLGVGPVLDAMRVRAEQTPCYFIAGNRDFLVRDEFSKASGFKILMDETVVDLYGTPTLSLTLATAYVPMILLIKSFANKWLPTINGATCFYRSPFRKELKWPTWLVNKAINTKHKSA